MCCGLPYATASSHYIGRWLLHNCIFRGNIAIMQVDRRYREKMFTAKYLANDIISLQNFSHTLSYDCVLLLLVPFLCLWRQGFTGETKIFTHFRLYATFYGVT